MTRSACSPLTRQYSWACSSCRTSGSAGGLAHADEHEREIAGDAVSPEARLGERVSREIRRADARGVRPEHARRDAIEENGLLVGQPQVLERGVHVGERHRERARRGAGVAILPDERERRRPVRRHAGGEGHPHERTRHQPEPFAQRRHRIEHRAGRARQRAPVERGGIGRRTAAAEEPRAVRLPLDGAAEPSVDAEDVKGPGRRLVGGARAPAEQQAGALRVVLRLDEQLPERGVGDVVLGTRQHDFRVARHLDFAGPIAAIGNREPPHLDVVLRRDGHRAAAFRNRRRAGGT